MDMFGNKGGFDALLDVMENAKLGENGLNLTIMGYFVTLFSMSSKLWHKKFIEDYAERVISALESRWLDSDDKDLRELD